MRAYLGHALSRERSAWWRWGLLLSLAVLLALVVATFLGRWVERAAERRLKAAASARGWDLSWRRMRMMWGGDVQILELKGRRGTREAAILEVGRLDARVDLPSVLMGRPRVRSLRVSEVSFRQPIGPQEDSLAALEALPAGEVLARVRETEPALAGQVRTFLRNATRDFARLPRLELDRVTVIPSGGPADSVVLDLLVFDPRARREVTSVRGRLYAPVAVPFSLGGTRAPGGSLLLRWRSSASVPGDHFPLAVRAAEFRLVPRPAYHWKCSARVHDLVVRGQLLSSRQVSALGLKLEGDLLLQPHPARIALQDSALLEIGRIPLLLGLQLDERGPTVRLRADAAGLTADLLRREIPPVILGPLSGVVLQGSFDYHLACRVDLSHPEDSQIRGDVVSHGLWIDSARSNPSFTALNEPFMALLHLPGGRIEERFVGAANPYFVPLAELPPDLVFAVLANEDGGFFQHRGFSVEAMRQALALNLRRGRFVRGAGTLSMQLVRNLWLGHERTMARKTQEVALTWLLENATDVSKDRLLEIYLNVIEWGPGIHGAGEAARFYFDKDARGLSLDEALFLTVLVPSPRLWRYRFDRATGELRRGTRRQMAFIGRAMARKGWLEAGRLPASDSLRVELRGPARDILFPPAPAEGAQALPP